MRSEAPLSCLLAKDLLPGLSCPGCPGCANQPHQRVRRLLKRAEVMFQLAKEAVDHTLDILEEDISAAGKEIERADGTFEEALGILESAEKLWDQTSSSEVFENELRNAITSEVERVYGKAKVMVKVMEMGYKAVLVRQRFLKSQQ